MDAGVMVLDLQERVLDINPAMKGIVDYSVLKTSAATAEEVCGKIPELVNACTDRSITHSEFIINKDGVSRVYEVFLSPLADYKGILIGRLVVTYDITEKKQDQQRYLKQQWEFAVQEERERLARDLHDNLGQVLGFINLQAQGIRQELVNADVNIVSNKLDKLVNVSQSAHNDIREYIRSTRNTAAMDKDFITGLTKDLMNFEEQSGINVELDIPVGFIGDELKPNIRINMLNIIKEALNNIRKHADANAVKITFLTVQDQLCVTVEDNGKGFEVKPSSNDAKNQFGLNIMRERAEEIGAHIDIQSVLEKGSCVALQVPIKKEE
jgi:PAS domain S-box-containing protein